MTLYCGEPISQVALVMFCILTLNIVDVEGSITEECKVYVWLFQWTVLFVIVNLLFTRFMILYSYVARQLIS